MFFFAFLWAFIWTIPAVSAMDSRVAFLLPNLANARVRVNDVYYVVTEDADALVQGVAFVKVRKVVDDQEEESVDESAHQKQLRPMAALKAYMCAMDVTQVDGKPYKLALKQKAIVKTVVERHANWNNRVKDTKKMKKNAVSTLNRALSTLSTYDVQLNNRGPQLGGDGTFRSTIVHKVDEAEAKLEALNQTLGDLADEEDSVFVTLSGIVSYFNDTFTMKLNERTLSQWRSRTTLPNIGRPAAFSPEAEEELIKTILYLDSCAFPMGPTEIRALAAQMTEDPKILARFSDEGPSKSWFKAFIARNKEKHPELVVVSKRNTNCNTTKWFNSELVMWWFAKFTDIVVQEDFAFFKDGKLEWTDAGRVLFTDETCVSGGGVRKASNGREKCVADMGNCARSELGKLCRLVGTQKDFEEHITLVGGHTAKGDLSPPGWVVTCSGIPTPKTRRLLTEGRLFDIDIHMHTYSKLSIHTYAYTHTHI
jgi:hypothetical protein